MNLLRAFTVTAVSTAIAGLIGFGTRAPYTPPARETAALRLSWRLRGEKEQHCRKRSADELARLPVHMRTPEVCTGRLITYRLVLRIDDRAPDTLLFAPAGAKGDRPIFVLHEERVTPGEHDIQIEFAPLDRKTRHDDDDDDDHRNDDHDREARARHYQARLAFTPGAVELITISPDARKLILVRSTNPDQPERLPAQVKRRHH